MRDGKNAKVSDESPKSAATPCSRVTQHGSCQGRIKKTTARHRLSPELESIAIRKGRLGRSTVCHRLAPELENASVLRGHLGRATARLRLPPQSRSTAMRRGRLKTPNARRPPNPKQEIRSIQLDRTGVTKFGTQALPNSITR